ncbi:MAG: hypothetical protein IKX67_10245 [Bacteroidales bacterium]|nr:hypothetical protein [Bacteroidales bacterium]
MNRTAGHIAALVLCFFACMCAGPGAGNISETAPVIETVSCDAVTFDSATLTASVTNMNLVAGCGFTVVSTSDNRQYVFDGIPGSDGFSITATGLQAKTEYNFSAFILNGSGMRIDSAPSSFTTLETQTPPAPLSFLQYLLRLHDTDGDGTLGDEEALAITELNIPTDSISTAPELKRLKNLEKLTARPHLLGLQSLMKELDISENLKLKELRAPRNDMERIIFPPEGSELTSIHINYNKLHEIDLRPLKKLYTATVNANGTRYLDISGLDELEGITLEPKPLETIILGNAILTNIDLSKSKITTLDLSRCPNMDRCDISGCESLTTVFLAKDQSESILINCPESTTIIHYDQ